VTTDGLTGGFALIAESSFDPVADRQQSQAEQKGAEQSHDQPHNLASHPSERMARSP